MQALYFLQGVNGQLTIYEDRVVISRSGILGFLTQGLAGDKSIPMSSLTSIQFKEGGSMFNGFIQFGVLGGRESQKGVWRATQDENTVMIKKDDNDAARKIANFIEAKIFEKNTSIGTPSISVADEIKKFKELLDLGVLTQEEFDKKKTELLNA